MTNTWIDCPVCEDSYDTQAEADACESHHFADGGMVRLPGGGYACNEDIWDPSEEDYVEAI